MIYTSDGVPGRDSMKVRMVPEGEVRYLNENGNIIEELNNIADKKDIVVVGGYAGKEPDERDKKHKYGVAILVDGSYALTNLRFPTSAQAIGGAAMAAYLCESHTAVAVIFNKDPAKSIQIAFIREEDDPEAAALAREDYYY